MSTAGAMRLALLSDWYLPRRGGIELHLADLAARLAAAGHQVDLLTTTPAAPADRDGRCSDLATPAGVRVVRLAVPRLPGAGIACTPALRRALAAQLDGARYDVVHAHASVVSPVAWAGVAAARRRGVPCVVTFHSMIGPAGVAAMRASDVVRAWTRGPVLVTGVSTVVAAALGRALPGARVAVLPNATDVTWWRAGAAARSAPPQHDGHEDGHDDGHSPRELRLVTAMRLAAKKRGLALPAVLAAARTAAAPVGRRVRLVIAGDGAERQAIARRAQALGHDASALALAGWQSRSALRALYRDADAFVLPTRHESFGIAALEARSAGLPVLGMRGTGLVDFVRDGVDGVLCTDDAALGRAAARLVTDDGWRQALGDASRATPPCAFDWPAVIARHEATYRRAGERD